MNIDLSNQAELLRWWHQYQAKMLNHEADLIRNGALQDIVAMRRWLEALCQNQPKFQDGCCKSYLAALERMYAQLETLSDRLAPPYVQNSLPLALQYAVLPWQEKIHLRIALPSAWEPEPLEHTRLLTLFAETLLQQLATAAITPQYVDLSLQHQADSKELRFQARYGESLSPSWTAKVSKSLKPFLSTFQVLTQGNHTQDLQAHSMAWVFWWKTQAQANSSSH